LNDILEIEFQIGYYMKIMPKFDNIEFFELIWLYERLAAKKKEEKENNQTGPGRFSMGDMFGG